MRALNFRSAAQISSYTLIACFQLLNQNQHSMLNRHLEVNISRSNATVTPSPDVRAPKAKPLWVRMNRFLSLSWRPLGQPRVWKLCPQIRFYTTRPLTSRVLWMPPYLGPQLWWVTYWTQTALDLRSKDTFAHLLHMCLKGQVCGLHPPWIITIQVIKGE